MVMRINICTVILFALSTVISSAQEISSEKLWDDFVEAINADYVEAQVKHIDMQIEALYNRFDSKCTNALLESTTMDIDELYDNKFITEEQQKSLIKLQDLLDNYPSTSEAFKSIFVQTIDDRMINTLLQMETIDSQQALMMTKAFWNIYEPKVRDLIYDEEYKYLNAKLNRFRDIFMMIITQDSSIKPNAYLDTLQEALKIESELIEEHTTYFKLR